MQQLPPSGPARLGAGARVAAAAVVLGGVALGSVLAFYGVGALLDLLLDRGAVTCGEQVGCGIGTGFLMVLVAAGGWVVGLVVALVLAPTLPARWSTRRALAAAGWAAGAVVLLTALAMMGVVVADAGNVTPR
jgi:hypothetical protein